eukprot:15099578-Alexandrium_andersonii.AAC.1
MGSWRGPARNCCASFAQCQRWRRSRPCEDRPGVSSLASRASWCQPWSGWQHQLATGPQLRRWS